MKLLIKYIDPNKDKLNPILFVTSIAQFNYQFTDRLETYFYGQYRKMTTDEAREMYSKSLIGQWNIRPKDQAKVISYHFNFTDHF